MLGAIHRPFVLLVSDTVRVIRVLVGALLGRRAARGHLLRSRYRSVGGEPEAAARRIISQWAGSLGPNRYVLGIDPVAEEIVVHELVASDGPLDPLELG
jgi:hypothetical protein